MNGHDLIDLGAHWVRHATRARRISASLRVNAGLVAECLVDPLAADAAVCFLGEHPGDYLAPAVTIGLSWVAHAFAASAFSMHARTSEGTTWGALHTGHQ